MVVRFGDVRAALHGEGPLPDGWAADAGTRRYVLDYIDRAKEELAWDGAANAVEFWGRADTTLRVTWRGKVLHTLHGAELVAWRWLRIIDATRDVTVALIGDDHQEHTAEILGLLDGVAELLQSPSPKKWPTFYDVVSTAVHPLRTRHDGGTDRLESLGNALFTIEHLESSNHNNGGAALAALLLDRAHADAPDGSAMFYDRQFSSHGLDISTKLAVKQLITKQWRPDVAYHTEVPNHYAAHMNERALDEVRSAPPGVWRINMLRGLVTRTHVDSSSRDWWYRKVHITGDQITRERRTYTARGEHGIIARARRLDDIKERIDARFSTTTASGPLFSKVER